MSSGQKKKAKQLDALQEASENEWGIQCRRCKREEHCEAVDDRQAAVIFYDLGWRESPFATVGLNKSGTGYVRTEGTRITCPTCKPAD